MGLFGGFNKDKKRFAEILYEGLTGGTNTIIKDKRTGVLYLFHNMGMQAD